MDERNFNRFKAVMQVVSAIGAVIVFFIGLHRHHTEQADLVRTRIEAEKSARQVEFRRELWLRQLDVVTKVADAAGRIAATATDTKSTEFDTAVEAYEQLYWGNVTFVDEQELVGAMDALRNEIRYFREGLIPIDGLSAQDKIKKKAHRLSLACRRTIRGSGKEYIELSGKDSVGKK